MTTAAIIVAAGRGTRAGDGPPKQWRPLAGRRVVDWTLQAFADFDHIVLVLSRADTDAWDEFADSRFILAIGGDDRAGSVRNGLAALAEFAPNTVLIHDVARPCVSRETIRAVQDSLATFPCAAPGVPVVDTLWTGADGQATGTRDRTGLYRAQTPQGFRYADLVAAHMAHPGGATDDVQVARDAGLAVAIVPGHEDNLKITTPEDFERAEKILRGQMDIRLGNGFDVHRFGTGDHVILCGVKVPHGRGLQGHSDADVGMHAITDAIYGALADGDIGQHFPPSDSQWEGAESHIFLRHAVARATERGFRIANVDCTLICERPKIGPHAPAMRTALADIMQIDATRISVKATTSEQLGFAGREEGIAALASATLVAG